MTLAHICQIEAGWSKPDCAAIWWIGVKRGKARGQEPIDALSEYSYPYRKPSVRGARIMAWPWGDVPDALDADQRRWRSQRTFALRLVRGEIADPCPEATEWNDKHSQPRGRMVRVCEGLTSNRLYAVRP